VPYLSSRDKGTFTIREASSTQRNAQLECNMPNSQNSGGSLKIGIHYPAILVTIRDTCRYEYPNQAPWEANEIAGRES
jgi:hypothetical protein